MSQIFSSASKIVFILISISVIGLTFTGKLDPKDFMVLASSVFAFYFGKQQQDPQITDISSVEKVG